MSKTQLGDDVSIIHLAEQRDVTSDSYGRRCTVKSSEFNGAGASNFNRSGSSSFRKIEHSGHYLAEMVMPLTSAQKCDVTRTSPQSHLKGESETIFLRDKVSFLFRENCSLKEHAAKLGIDNRLLQSQVSDLKHEILKLRERLHQSQQLKDGNSSLQTNSPMARGDVPKSIVDTYPSKLVINKSQVPPELCNMEHLWTNRDQIQMLDNFATSTEESQHEKELFEIIETFQKNSFHMKQIIQVQNKVLKEWFKQTTAKVTNQNKGLTSMKNNKIIPDATRAKEAEENVLKASVPDLDKIVNIYSQWANETNTPMPDDGTQAGDDEWICPMCNAIFPKTMPLLEFETHVMDHFRSDEFEIITHDGEFS